MQQLANMRQQNIDDLVETLVNQAWPDESEEINELAGSDAAATPEMQTYIALHPVLKEKYFGQYVAIYQGKLIDHDPDHEALYLRIDAQYPDEFVWISRVEEEAIPTLVPRSHPTAQYSTITTG
ncbi:MAG: hypothetical protein DCC55_24350 [Chloroflexi bacterium]|nr:MAG: hypothetical protein DCC55_24350 [Chloroflexota bacterium]